MEEMDHHIGGAAREAHPQRIPVRQLQVEPLPGQVRRAGGQEVAQQGLQVRALGPEGPALVWRSQKSIYIFCK